MTTTRNLLAALVLGGMLIAPLAAQANCDEKQAGCCSSKKAKKASMTMKKSECTDAAKVSTTTTTATPAPVAKSDAPQGQSSTPK